MFWVFVVLSLILFVVGFTAFPISMYMEEKTGRYDFYSVFGFAISALSLLLGIVCAVLTVATKIILRRASKSDDLSII